MLSIAPVVMAHSRSQSRKGVQAGGEGAEGAHVGRGAAAVGRGGDELLGDDVNAGGVRVVGGVEGAGRRVVCAGGFCVGVGL